MSWFTPTSLLSALPSLPSLPSIPAVPLPKNVQHRLVAFLLRRALGAFVRDDGWEGDRVEADVRGGRVKVRDLEVDPEAINSLLSSDDEAALSAPIKLISGRLSSVTANVVYPSLSLSAFGGDAKLDFEVEGAELVFRVRDAGDEHMDESQEDGEEDAKAPPPRPGKGRSRTMSGSSTSSSFSTSSTSTNATHDVSSSPDSLPNPYPLSLSLAQSFLSSAALSPSEESQLRSSLHLPPAGVPSVSGSVDLPGAFGGARLPDGDGGRTIPVKEEEVDTVEAGILAGVVERLLARLSVKVKRVTVRVLWVGRNSSDKGEYELRLEVDEVGYRGAGNASEGKVAAPALGTRNLSVSPPRIYFKSSSVPSPPPQCFESASPVPSVPYASSLASHKLHAQHSQPSLTRSDSDSSSSEEDSGDESDFLAMSQSIADLRTSTASLSLSRSSAASMGGTSEAGRSSLRGSGMFRSAREFGSVVEEAEESGESPEMKEAKKGKAVEEDPFHDPDDDGDEAFETPQGSPAQEPKELPQRLTSPSLVTAGPSPEKANEEGKGNLIVALGSPSSSAEAEAESLVFTLSTPSVISSASSAASTSAPTKTTPLLSARLSQGWVLALDAKQAGALAEVVERLPSSSSPGGDGGAASVPGQRGGPLGVQLDLKLSGVDLFIAYSAASSSAVPASSTADEVFSKHFWSSPSTRTPETPHFHLRMSDLSLSTAATSAAPAGLSLSIAVLSVTETFTSTATNRPLTLPLLVSDPSLTRTLLDAGEVDAVDWVKVAAGVTVEGGERWSKEGMYLGMRKKRDRRGKGEREDKVPEQAPAIRVEVPLNGVGGGPDVKLEPLHAFLDLTILERVKALVEAMRLPSSSSAASAKALATPPARTPRPSTPTPKGRHRDILHNLAYPSSTSTSMDSDGLTLACTLFRLSIRCPAPSTFSASEPLGLRSGRVLLDLPNLRLSLPSSATTGASFRASTEELSLRFAALSSTRARPIARIAPLVPLTGEDGGEAALPSCTIPSAAPPTEVAISVPLVHIQMDKPAFDGVQLFVDDVGQCFAARSSASSCLGDSSSSFSRGDGGQEREKILGSRYFAKPVRRGGEEEMEGSTATVRGGTGVQGYGEGRGKGQVTFKLRTEVTDVIVDLSIDSLPPAANAAESAAIEALPTRHLRASGSDLSVSLELVEDAEDDLRARVSLMDLQVEDTSASSAGTKRVLLARTLPRNLAAPIPPSPLLHLDFASACEPGTSVKESRIALELENATVFLRMEDVKLAEEVRAFAKTPEGAFDNVVPTDLTAVRLSLTSISVVLSAPTLPSQIVLSLSTLFLRTDLVPDLPRTSVHVDVAGAKVWAIDSEADLKDVSEQGAAGGARDERWRRRGFVQLAEVENADVAVKIGNGLVLPDLEIVASDAQVEVALCADSIASLSRFAEDLTSAEVFQSKQTTADLLASVDPAAFEHAPALHDMPEILDDDVPTNLDYLADGLNQTSMRPKKHRRGASSISSSLSGSDAPAQGELISDVDGETIRMLSRTGIAIVDEWLAEPRVEEKDFSAPASKIRCRLVNTDLAIHLHEGYDWFTTRKAIEEETKAIRRRLEKIRQLLASGQTPDGSAEKDASVLMFGSLQLGLPPGARELAPKDLLAAINEELNDSPNSDAVSTTSSWQTFPGGSGDTSSSARRPAPAVVGKSRKKLTRSRTFAMQINLRGVSASYDAYSVAPASSPGRSMYTSMLLPTARSQLASKLAVDVSSLDIIDNIRTSTWRKFLTELRPNDGGQVRATGAPMAKVEMSTVRPIEGVKNAKEEILLKIKVTPVRLYIDQDALDFLKAFGAFELPSPAPPASSMSSPSAKSEPFYQRVEVFPVKIKLDYKPKRVDYNALRSGKTAELMNFFHFDGSEMTLRHLVVTGISGTSTLSTLVQDIWTPDVKAHQLADVISGIAPVRSVVNVGSGVANLVLLPIEQYRKDGRIARGLQKGATAFAKQTTLEAINVGAKLANGTQVILEQAEHVLGAKFNVSIATETVPDSPTFAGGGEGLKSLDGDGSLSDEEQEVRSRYANQPSNVKQGVESAYRSLRENVKEGAQTILAVPMEVYERSANEGPVKAVVRAVPIAVLKPMIGASGAISKALLGLRNSLDPEAQEGELEDKYKAAEGRRG
ncbi:hypothetical protein JCM11251_000826 [Rhodosporidiobolus azoricus]